MIIFFFRRTNTTIPLRMRQRRPDRAVYVPRARRSQILSNDTQQEQPINEMCNIALKCDDIDKIEKKFQEIVLKRNVCYFLNLSI